MTVLLTQCPNPFDADQQQSMKYKFILFNSFQRSIWYTYVHPLKSLSTFVPKLGRRFVLASSLFFFFYAWWIVAHNSIGWRKKNQIHHLSVWLFLIIVNWMEWSQNKPFQCICNEIGNNVLMFIAAWRLQKRNTIFDFVRFLTQYATKNVEPGQFWILCQFNPPSKY